MFLDDEDKMRDLKDLSKEEFLKSYSYLKEEDYVNKTINGIINNFIFFILILHLIRHDNLLMIDKEH